MTEQKKTIEDKVMSQIDTGKVKLRSRYVFLAEKLGLGSVIILSILLGALFFTLLLYYLDKTDNLVYLSFGEVGVYAFLESFPYLFVIGFILLVFVAGILLKKTDFSYQKPFAYSSISLMIVVIVAGAALTYTGIGQAMEKVGYTGCKGSVLRPFLHHCFIQRKYGVAGQVVQVEQESIILLTPDGLLKITFHNAPPLDPNAVGKYIVVVGEKKGEIFNAVQIRVIPQERIPLIHRGLQRRFQEHPEMYPSMQPPHLPFQHTRQFIILLGS